MGIYQDTITEPLPGGSHFPDEAIGPVQGPCVPSPCPAWGKVQKGQEKGGQQELEKCRNSQISRHLAPGGDRTSGCSSRPQRLRNPRAGTRVCQTGRGWGSGHTAPELPLGKWASEGGGCCGDCGPQCLARGDSQRAFPCLPPPPELRHTRVRAHTQAVWLAGLSVLTFTITCARSPSFLPALMSCNVHVCEHFHIRHFMCFGVHTRRCKRGNTYTIIFVHSYFYTVT